MVLPIYDGAPLKYLRKPIANWSLIAINILIFLCVYFGLFGDSNNVDLALGVVPAVVTGQAVLPDSLLHLPVWLTLITGMFLHGGWLHVGGNMLFLWVFGDNVEDAMGSVRYVIFYLLCGIFAAIAYVAAATSAEVTLIGASGAISGVLVAYLMLYPHVRILTLVFDIIPLRLPAMVVVSAWIVLQIGSALFSGDSGVAWVAHLGGIAAGAVLTPFFKRRDMPLFGPRRN